LLQTANKTLVQQIRAEVTNKYTQALIRWDEYIPLPTGIYTLDHELLQGGLPSGHLIEIVGSKSSGKTTLLFKILSGLSKQEKGVAYFDFSGTFYPPSAQKSGIDLTKLIVLRPKNIQSGLRGAEILFKSGGICVAIFDMVGTEDQIPKALLLRLKKNVKQAHGIGILLREPDSTKVQKNQIALCLKVKKMDQKLFVRIEKSLFGMANKSVEAVLNE
jgi:RecA/RadA recombinase